MSACPTFDNLKRNGRIRTLAKRCSLEKECGGGSCQYVQLEDYLPDRSQTPADKAQNARLTELVAVAVVKTINTR